MKENPLPIQVKEPTPWNPDFIWWLKMAGIFLGIIVCAYVSFYALSKIALHYIDIEKEKEYFWEIFLDNFSGSLLDESILHYPLPEEIRQDVYIVYEWESNAFATIGAKILVTDSLLDEVENQEELLFIIGHEMAHRENQDALRAFLVHAPFSVTMMLLGFDSTLPYSEISHLMVRYIDRNIESQADQWGIELLDSLWLNAECAIWFFERNMIPWEQFTKFISTHPISQERIDFIRESAWKNKDKPCTPLVTEKEPQI